MALDEAKHHLLLTKRLEEIGGKYGDFPAHDGLWQSAMETSDSLMHRLVVEHCVHEARGLDVMPNTINKFRENGDEESALLLETIVYPEEIGHVKAGLKWFKFLLGDASERGGEETVKIFSRDCREEILRSVENRRLTTKRGRKPGSTGGITK